MSEHNHNHDSGIDKLNAVRFMSALKSLSELFAEYGEERLSGWFQRALEDFQAIVNDPHKFRQQLALVEQVFMKYTGFNDFRETILKDEAGNPHKEDNEKMQAMARQLWAASRGLQSHLEFALSEIDSD